MPGPIPVTEERPQTGSIFDIIGELFRMGQREAAVRPEGSALDPARQAEMLAAIRNGTFAEWLERANLSTDEYAALVRFLAQAAATAPVAEERLPRGGPLGASMRRREMLEQAEADQDEAGPPSREQMQAALAQATAPEVAMARGVWTIESTVDVATALDEAAQQLGQLYGSPDEARRILLLNNPWLKKAENVGPGDVLVLGAPRVHRWRFGDTLASVAKQYGLTLEELIRTFQDAGIDPDTIVVGQQVPLPPEAPPPQRREGPGGEQIFIHQEQRPLGGPAVEPGTEEPGGAEPGEVGEAPFDPLEEAWETGGWDYLIGRLLRGQAPLRIAQVKRRAPKMEVAYRLSSLFEPSEDPDRPSALAERELQRYLAGDLTTAYLDDLIRQYAAHPDESEEALQGVEGVWDLLQAARGTQYSPTALATLYGEAARERIMNEYWDLIARGEDPGSVLDYLLSIGR